MAGAYCVLSYHHISFHSLLMDKLAEFPGTDLYDTNEWHNDIVDFDQ